MGAVLLVLLAAAPSPRVAPSADFYLYVPRLDRLDGVRAFTTLAGKKTAMMKPAIWSEELLPLLAVDLTSPESLSAAGIDPSGSLTASFTPSGLVACVSLSNPGEFVTRARRSYSMQGTKWTGAVPNATFGAVANPNASVTAGYAQRGNTGCVVKSGRGRGGTMMQELDKLLGAPKVPASWKNASVLQGPLYFASQNLVAAVRASETTLTLDGRGVKLPVSLPPLSGAGPSPYANIPHSGVLSLRARVDPAATLPYARNFALQLMSFCAGCNDKALSDAVVAVTSELTGNLYLRVDSIALNTGTLKTDEGRYFAVRHAYAAELKNAAAAQVLIDKLPEIKGVQRSDKGLQLTTTYGTIDLRIVGQSLVISNDTSALNQVTGLLGASKPGTMAHALEAQADPKPLGKALRKLSLLDAMSSSQLATYFAAGVEFGPLLSASERATFWADAGNPMKGQAVWVLELPRPPPQATPDAGSVSPAP